MFNGKKVGFMKINEKIKHLREGKHWSQEEMAQKLNMSKNGYAKIERGETSASLGRLEQVAAVLGIGLCELLADVCGGVLHEHCADDARGNAENVLLLQQARQIIELKDEIIANKEQVIAALRHEIEWLNEKIARLQSCDRPKSSLHSDIFLKDNVL